MQIIYRRWQLTKPKILFCFQPFLRLDAVSRQQLEALLLEFKSKGTGIVLSSANISHLLPLCEIIAGEKTSPENVQKMRSLVESLGKQPVVVADINGFIINRIQFALLREALHIVDIGAATFEDVDTVLKAGMGLRYAALGPFGVADFGGLDTFDHINSYLNAELDDSKVGNKRLHEMVEAGKLGVKSGQGFYDYSGDKADAAIRERDRLYIELAKVLYFKK